MRGPQEHGALMRSLHRKDKHGQNPAYSERYATPAGRTTFSAVLSGQIVNDVLAHDHVNDVLALIIYLLSLRW